MTSQTLSHHHFGNPMEPFIGPPVWSRLHGRDGGAGDVALFVWSCNLARAAAMSRSPGMRGEVATV